MVDRQFKLRHEDYEKVLFLLHITDMHQRTGVGPTDFLRSVSECEKMRDLFSERVIPALEEIAESDMWFSSVFFEDLVSAVTDARNANMGLQEASARLRKEGEATDLGVARVSFEAVFYRRVLGELDDLTNWIYDVVHLGRDRPDADD